MVWLKQGVLRTGVVFVSMENNTGPLWRIWRGMSSELRALSLGSFLVWCVHSCQPMAQVLGRQMCKVFQVGQEAHLKRVTLSSLSFARVISDYFFFFFFLSILFSISWERIKVFPVWFWDIGRSCCNIDLDCEKHLMLGVPKDTRMPVKMAWLWKSPRFYSWLHLALAVLLLIAQDAPVSASRHGDF